MGFTTIYLIGMDNKYMFGMNRDGSVFRNEKVCNSFGEEYQNKPIPTHAPATWEFDLAYQIAEEHTKKIGVKIYNATRGGFLEVFERINLDNILKESE